MVYESTGGALKLKGVSDKKIKKKKKSKSSMKDSLSSVNIPSATEEVKLGEVKTSAEIQLLKTKAELAFERTMNKRLEENILKKAEKSHKEHVEVYNKHLESLSEFHDIPKVSWTK